MTQAKSPPPDALLPDWDAKAREIANDVHGRSYGWLVTNIATALRTAHAAGLSERDAGWQPIESAPRDGRVIWYYAPAREGLRAMQGLVAWHPDAGFCVDEIRVVTHWQSKDRAPPATKDTTT